MRGVSRLWKALIHVLAFGLHGFTSKGHIASVRFVVRRYLECSVSITAGNNPGEHDFACEVLDYGILSFDRWQCIEFLTRPAVAEGRHLKLRDHHHDTGGMERYVSPTPSKTALINTSIPIVHTAAQSQVIEHQRNYLLRFPSTLCPTRPGLCKLQDSAVGIYHESAATDCCHCSASTHVPWQITHQYSNSRPCIIFAMLIIASACALSSKLLETYTLLMNRN